ncbi:5-methyltetrahydropteroyltriglutamate--homocysteine S-methyltransferase [Kurthia sibirica]|uniref:5-methyltetrahydropteroyltriglutamate--homocysteine methyltransferase n=1 Tax=Kurthia sibirica TaxID=202750 RepID=A0A2U3AKQ4_9BACL|nr:5-methyltetrahydropteroyltriglutamate--homocysteine S-methyltransferase [Kurthia sibirica]PWI25105.1 5-methyltetrahydropteroyltriglutamate--homocysteine S-methyltransferase [Kurthia sibirica]GEK34025.1 5-methyltetrahydropteroyltriglutamate--homocysteine methyltransferase [Kurthia sibirica]
MNLVKTVVGYPYIGDNRQWKRVVESFWKDAISEEEFRQQMHDLRIAYLKRQQALGVDLLTVGDFTLYDRILDLSVMFGLVPARYHTQGNQPSLDTYYAMARGAKDVVACEMTKWFNTNYHYIVPEYEEDALSFQHNYLLEYFEEAKNELGVITKPTLIGPYTFLTLTKGYSKQQRAAYILALIPLYARVINELTAAGATWIQLEEPALTKTLADDEVKLVEEIYQQLAAETTGAQLLIETYFEALTAYDRLIKLPVAGIGLDFVHGKKENMEAIRKFGFPTEKLIAIGCVNGRDIWSANLAQVTSDVKTVLALSGVENAWIQSSCSLQHVPVTTASEQKIAVVLKEALSFADEKIQEIIQIADHLVTTDEGAKQTVSHSTNAIEALAADASRQNQKVKQLIEAVTEQQFSRETSYENRQIAQQEALQLPDFPTTTIGSFPQSADVKKMRAQWRKKEITDEQYADFVKKETARWIHIQEEIGLDVFVHGEFERTDMVEYFGEKLTGFAFTDKAWVVSYGSRCVKPPIIYGDVEWTEAMTVKEIVNAQSLTNKYVKGMLTGPVTILNWSFVRDDIPRELVANQIALALRQEIAALEEAGIVVIQVDEPALREGLPLRQENKDDYLNWAVRAFKLATSSVLPTTQIHTHMCYCEFNDFIGPIRALDADVISLETSRSHGELIDSLQENHYELGIGLGVYDIHSPRIPKIEEITAILTDSLQVIDRKQFWVNPDCGLKTRQQYETVEALKNMVAATQKLRQQVKTVN